MKAPAVYILASRRNGTLYIGVTSNLIQRIWQHREGLAQGFTQKYDVKTLVWYEQHETMQSAIGREKALKKWNRDWKLRLVEARNPQWLDLWPEITGQQPYALNEVPSSIALNRAGPQRAPNETPVRRMLNDPSLPSTPPPSFPNASVGNPAAPLDSRLRGNDDSKGDEQ